MGVLLLSTLSRVRRAVNKTGANSVDDAILLSDLASVSQTMQSYCSMRWHRSTYTETRSGNTNGILYLAAKPISSVSSVSVLYKGQLQPQTVQSAQYSWIDGNELHYSFSAMPLDRVIVTYVGGLADSTATSTEAVTAYTGSVGSGDAFSSASARGTVTSFDASSMTAQITVTDGALSPGDVLSTDTATLTLGDTVVPSILSDFPDLAEKCDEQTAYLYQRRNSPGRRTVQAANGQSTFEDSVKLLPGVIEVLEYYDHQFLGS